MPNGTTKNFFISYNRADRSWAEWIAWHLEEAGYTTVLQAWDFRPSSNFVVDMQRAPSDAERTIAVLSPDYLTSSFTQPEWAAEFAQDPTSEKGLLLPVRVRDCDPKGLLSQIVPIDILGLEETAAKNALLAGVVRGRVKPANKPDFPGTNHPEVVANLNNLGYLMKDKGDAEHQRVYFERARVYFERALALTKQPTALIIPT